jgi:hypothetical protein
MKDVDLENLIMKKHLSIDIPPEDIELIMTTIKRDLDFLV